MLSVTVRLYGDLPAFAGGRDHLVRRLAEPTTTKDLVEAVGVPHPEVELLLVDGEPSSFARLVADGQRVAVFPHAYTLGGEMPLPLRPPVHEPSFLLDGHLGRLTVYLRMLGFDAWYERDAPDAVLADASARDGRVLLTRDRGLLKRSAVVHGYFLRSDDPQRQLTEVVARFDLGRCARPFTRCLRCNGELESVAKEEVDQHLEPLTRRYYDEFARCRRCGGIFWKGSHHQRMAALAERALTS